LQDIYTARNWDLPLYPSISALAKASFASLVRPSFSRALPLKYQDSASSELNALLKDAESLSSRTEISAGLDKVLSAFPRATNTSLRELYYLGYIK